MTARLTRLRIAGFKSFAEAASLDILPGLTGIVGPNGCGKSNVVEALRWAMGETSARSLRGGEMDDVIFAGSTARASRNLAEVTVTLEAGGAPLPAPFETEPELQVTRRIERGAGSAFRANGRELRARDVQTLYADLSSGARSSGMVSQGRVSALVNARPEERRQVLEEAAGITGLHARRHEAELKLKAAEHNVARAEDLHTQLDGTRDGLRRQARQALRYRNLSGLLRAAEAEHLSVLHGQAASVLALAAEETRQADALAEAAAQEQRSAAAALAEADAALPGPRRDEAAARSLLERRRFEAESLATERAVARQQAQEAADRLAELQADLEGAAGAREDAARSTARLTDEHASLAGRLASLPDVIARAASLAATAREQLQSAEIRADEAGSQASAASQATQQANDALSAAAGRLAALRDRHAAARTQLAAGADARIDPAQLAECEAQLVEGQAELLAARAELELAELARAEAAAASLDGQARVARERAARDLANQLAEAARQKAANACQACGSAEESLSRMQACRPDPDRVQCARDTAEDAEAVRRQAEAEIDLAEIRAAEAGQQAAEAGRAAGDAASALARASEAANAAQERAARLAQDVDGARSACAEAERLAPTDDTLQDAGDACRHAQAAVLSCEADHHRCESARRESARRLAAARALAGDADAEVARLVAEASGLEAALDSAGDADGILAVLSVPAGLEAAVGVALGEAGRASLDEAAPRFWRDLPPSSAANLPDGGIALSSLVQAPSALSRVLSHVALLADGCDGDAVQPGLAPGMVAVDRAGACWRWDGLVTRAGAPNPAAIQLAQRRRLAAAQAALGAAREAAHQAGHKCVAAERDEGDAAASEDAARAARSQAETAFGSAARRLEQLESEAALSAARILSLRSVAERLQIARAAADREVEAARLAVESLPCPIALEAAQGDAERRAGEAAGALDRARESRSAARAHAAATRQAALDLAAELSQADVLIEAAAAALARAVAARDSALQDAAAAEAALDAQPDPSILAAELDRLSDRDASCRARETAARDRRQAAEAALDQARHLLATLQTAHVQAESRYAALTDHAERLSADYREAQRQHDEAARTVATLPDASQLEHAAQAARVLCVAARQAAGESEAGLVALRGERDQGERTLTGLQAELTAWQQRLEDADSRLAGLAARHSAGQSAARALASRPDEIDARSGRAGQALTDAEEAWKAAAARLEAAELHLRALANAERDAGRQAIQGRERQMRAQAAHEARGAALHAVLARVVERLGEDAVPDALPDLSEAAELRARRRFERLVREREEMGPVNLRAELELETLEARITALEAERAELGTAIAKLRGAIGHLNREGRERLSAVFTQVDQHFRALFTRMMGGGRAHLALTGSEDPLAAGLEIFAEPPGKKLSALSLLSGGEQALTALSLIFAVFRCTPAPVCVLDEVDAPLDDANVERFCSLLDEMVRETGTSFLVVTHHQLTMSRMDRLFGVTMQERGVSRLLSVDLRRAVAMAEPVMQAAE